MLHIALLEPQIPPNTGNISRLCAANGCPLHLIGPLGFRIDDKSLRRAGLDYWDAVDLRRHANLAEFEEAMRLSGGDIHCLSARVAKPYTQIPFKSGAALLFGAETRGLPPEVLERYAAQCYTIPMLTKNVRSLNLGTSAGIVLYEGLRQLHAWPGPAHHQ